MMGDIHQVTRHPIRLICAFRLGTPRVGARGMTLQAFGFALLLAL